MIKKIIINRRTIPVPVPLKTMADVLNWVDETLVREQQVLTKVLLDGQEFSPADDGVYARTAVNQTSKVELQLDSPNELAIQTIETVLNLVSVVERGLKPLAVACWDSSDGQVPMDAVESVREDIAFVVELLDHFLDLTDLEKVQLNMMYEIRDQIVTIQGALEQAKKEGLWQDYAKILLNNLEPCLVELDQESGNIQALTFSKRCDDREKTRVQA